MCWCCCCWRLCDQINMPEKKSCVWVYGNIRNVLHFTYFLGDNFWRIFLVDCCCFSFKLDCCCTRGFYDLSIFCFSIVSNTSLSLLCIDIHDDDVSGIVIFIVLLTFECSVYDVTKLLLIIDDALSEVVLCLWSIKKILDSTIFNQLTN